MCPKLALFSWLRLWSLFGYSDVCFDRWKQTKVSWTWMPFSPWPPLILQNTCPLRTKKTHSSIEIPWCVSENRGRKPPRAGDWLRFDKRSTMSYLEGSTAEATGGKRRVSLLWTSGGKNTSRGFCTSKNHKFTSGKESHCNPIKISKLSKKNAHISLNTWKFLVSWPLWR